MNAPATKKDPPAPVLDFTAARLNMVESQLHANHVQDNRILTTMSRLPRELFVPPILAHLAYADADVQVGKDRFMMSPMVFALLLQAAEIEATDSVLVIAPTTGYSVVVAAALAGRVVGIEPDESFVTQAKTNLATLNVANAAVVAGDPAQGWDREKPYNVILIDGGVEVLPPDLSTQLAEGGRIIGVFNAGTEAVTVGVARRMEKWHDTLNVRALFNANVKPLAAFMAKPTFRI